MKDWIAVPSAPRVSFKRCSVKLSSPLVRVVESGRWVLAGAYLLLFAFLVWAWQQPQWRAQLEPQALAAHGRQLLDMPLGPVMVLLGYVVAVMMAMPVAALITVGVLVFGPWPGMAYALFGMVAGSIVTYGIGRFTGATLVDRWSTRGKVHVLASLLKRRGLWAVFIIRALPVAPFIMVNMTAGAFRVRFRDYVLGTLLGLVPGTVIIALFMDRLKAAFADPGVTTVALLLGFAALFGAVMWWMRRLARQGSDVTPRSG